MSFQLALGRLGFRVEADISGFVSGMGKAERRMKGLGSVARGAQRALNAMGQTTGAAFSYSVKKAASFEQAIQTASAVSKGGIKNYGAYMQAAIKAGNASAFSAEQAGKSLQFLSMAGLTADQAVKSLPETLTLASAAAVSLGKAADISTNIMTSFGKKAEDLSHINDVLVGTFTNSNTTLTSLASSIKYVGSVAKGTGNPFEDMAAAIGKMGDAGIQGSMAGRTLRTSILRLAAPPKKAAKALQKLGITTRDSQGNLLKFVDVLGQLEKAGAKTSDLDKIFGKESVAGIQALMSQGSESIKRFSHELQNMGGVAKNVEQTMLNTLSGQMKILQGIVETTAAKFGMKFFPALKQIVEVAQDVVKGMDDGSISLKGLGMTSEEISTTMADLLDIFNQVTQVTLYFIGVAIELVKAFKVLGLTVEVLGMRFRDMYILASEGPEAFEKSFQETQKTYQKLKDTISDMGQGFAKTSSLSKSLSSVMDKTSDRMRSYTQRAAEATKQQALLNRQIQKQQQLYERSLGGGGRSGYGSNNAAHRAEMLMGRKAKGGRGGWGSQGSKLRGGEQLHWSDDKGFYRQVNKHEEDKKKRSRAHLKRITEAQKKAKEAEKKAAEAWERQMSYWEGWWDFQDAEKEKTKSMVAKAMEKALKKEEEKLAEARIKAAEERLDRFRKNEEKLKAAADQFSSAAASLGDSFKNLVLGKFQSMIGVFSEKASNALGAVVSGIQAGAAAGPMGMAVGGAIGFASEYSAPVLLFEAITEHKKFAEITEMVGKQIANMDFPDIVGTFLENLQPAVYALTELIGAFRPVASLFDALLPSTRQLFNAAKIFGIAITYVAQFMTGLIELPIWIVKGVTDLLKAAFKALPDWLEPDSIIEPLEGASKRLGQVKTTLDETQARLKEARENLEGLTLQEAKDNIKALGDAAKDASEELKNVPDIIKINLRRGQAQQGGDIPSGADVAYQGRADNNFNQGGNTGYMVYNWIVPDES